MKPSYEVLHDVFVHWAMGVQVPRISRGIDKWVAIDCMCGCNYIIANFQVNPESCDPSIGACKCQRPKCGDNRQPYATFTNSRYTATLTQIWHLTYYIVQALTLLCRITDQIGSGNFGYVHKGVWHTTKGDRAVAVKKLKENANSADRVKFLQEAAVNGQFRHPNVVSLLGVVTIGDPVSSGVCACVCVCVCCCCVLQYNHYPHSIKSSLFSDIRLFLSL